MDWDKYYADMLAIYLEKAALNKLKRQAEQEKASKQEVTA